MAADQDNPLAGQDVSTKYGPQRSAQSSEWRWRHERGEPRITEHLQKRWDDRTPAGSVAPETAWLHARDAGELMQDHFSNQAGESASEVRLYHGRADGEEYTMIFIAMNSADGPGEYHIRTVYRYNMLSDSRVRAYLAVVRDYFINEHGRGGADADLSDASETAGEQDAAGTAVEADGGQASPPTDSDSNSDSDPDRDRDRAPTRESDGERARSESWAALPDRIKIGNASLGARGAGLLSTDAALLSRANVACLPTVAAACALLAVTTVAAAVAVLLAGHPVIATGVAALAAGWLALGGRYAGDETPVRHEGENAG